MIEKIDEEQRAFINENIEKVVPMWPFTRVRMEGVQEGMEKGMQEGMEKGMEKGMDVLVSFLREGLGIEEAYAKAKLAAKA